MSGSWPLLLGTLCSEATINARHTSVWNNVNDIKSVISIQAEQMEADKQLLTKATDVTAKSKAVKQSLTEKEEQMKALLAKLVKMRNFLQEKHDFFTSGSAGAEEVRKKIAETAAEKKRVLQLIEEEGEKQMQLKMSIEEKTNELLDIKMKSVKVDATIDELKKKLKQSNVDIFEQQKKMRDMNAEMEQIVEKKSKDIEAVHQFIVDSKELDVKIAEVERSNLEEKARLQEEKEKTGKWCETEQKEIAQLEKELEGVQKCRDDLKEKLKGESVEELAEKNRILEEQAKKNKEFDKSDNSFLTSESFYSGENIRNWIKDTNYQSSVSENIEFPSALEPSGSSTSSRSSRKTRRTRTSWRSNKKMKLSTNDDCEVTSTYNGDYKL